MTAAAGLHAQLEALRRELLAAGIRPVHELTVVEAREAERLEPRPASAEPVAEVVDRALPGPAGEMAARFYRPDAPQPCPALVYFHGGGWVLGSLNAVDAVCRRLANAARCAVVSVDYRLAPEHPFPAGLEDCYAATRWVAECGGEHGLDGNRLAVGGASSGGNLAAAVALLARRRGGPPLLFQLLVYPPLDHRAADRAQRMRLDRPFFSAEDLAWCWRKYLADDEDGANPLASPLRAVDLRGLPPALLITAELDPLCDESELYAARLREANVPAQVARFDGVAHGFFSLSDRLDAAAEAQALAAAALRGAFAVPAARV
jgi:acetyl esterase/lipase